MKYLYVGSTFVILAFVVFGIQFLAGCSGDNITNPPVTVEPTFSSIQQNIFARSCASSSCHSTLSQRGGLILEEGKAYNSLVGVVAENTAARNQGLKRVAPGTPDSSFLLIKLTGPTPDQGSRMPDGNDPLSQQAINAVRTWIANGAKAD